jgi:hypothetical protein
MHAGEGTRWFGSSVLFAADFERSNDGRVFVYDRNTRRVYRTSDQGLTWDSSAVADPGFRAFLAVDREGRLVAGSGGLYRSTDLGDTWVALDTSTAESVRSVAIDSSGRILAALGLGLGRFDEANRLWEPFTAFPPLLYGVSRIAVMRDGTLFTRARREGIYRSTDDGAIWTRLDVSDSADFEVADGLLVVLDGEVIRASRDRGTTFFEIGRDLAPRAAALSISPGGRIFVGTRFGLFRSTEPLRSDLPESRPSGRDAELASLLVYPNPARDHIEVTYVLPRRASPRITIVDACGRERLRVLEEVRDAGIGRAKLDLGQLPPGVYAVCVEVGERVVARMVKW